MDLTVVVLAAGMGSRYGSLKQLDGVGPKGETLLEYALYDALKAGFNKVVFIVRESFEKEFRLRYGSTIEKKCEVTYCHQEMGDLPPGFSVPAGREKPWGTAHATLAARKVVKNPFIVINADDFYGPQSYQVAADYLTDKREKALHSVVVGYPILNTISEHGSVNRGVCEQSAAGELLSIVERLNIEKRGGELSYDGAEGERAVLTGRELVSMNMIGFTEDMFSLMEEHFVRFLNENLSKEKEEFFLPLVLNNMIREKVGSVEVIETDESWFGVTYREDKEKVVARLVNLVEKGVYPAPLWR